MQVSIHETRFGIAPYIARSRATVTLDIALRRQLCPRIGGSLAGLRSWRNQASEAPAKERRKWSLSHRLV